MKKGGEKVQRKPITAQDILNTPGIILGIAALIVIVGAIAPWYSGWGWSRSGWDAGQGKITVFMALIMLGTAAVSMGYIRSPLLERTFPILSVSAVCGLTTLITCLVSTTASTWGLYLTFFGGLVALFAAYRAYAVGAARGL
jgi:hypothetical protein